MSRRIARGFMAALLAAATGLAILRSDGECGQAIGAALTRQAAALLTPAELGFAQQRMQWWD
ncbi:MAG TPA: hypothetical protein VGA00_07170 [Acidiferrobacterales bacterium]|jgi:hypothetical protein